jgi:hypothetical protein
MVETFTADEIVRLRQTEERLRRNLLFVALLDRKLGRPSPVQRPIVVGGSAVEFYTTGGYASADMDLVMLHPEDADRILGASGFQRRGRYWLLPDTDLLVEFPGQTLTYAPGAYDRLTEVEMGDGLAATVIGIEDILIGRLYAGISERRENDRRWALEMAVLHYDRLDWDAVDALAAANGIADAVHTLRAEALAIAHP